MTTTSRPTVEPERSTGRPPSAATAERTEAATALARIRAELVDLHATMLGLQATLAPALAAAALDGTVAEAAQGLDLVTQSLDGLSTFVGALTASAERSGRFDVAAAAASVDIGALSSRLAGRPPPTPQDRGRGEVELF